MFPVLTSLFVLFSFISVLSNICDNPKLSRGDALVVIDVQNDFMESVRLESFHTHGDPHLTIDPHNVIERPSKNLIKESEPEYFLKAGSIPVSGTKDFIPKVNEWISEFQTRRLPIFISIDWHPSQHCSFCKNSENTPCGPLGSDSPRSGGRICLDNRSQQDLNKNQLYQWPEHCRMGSFGAQLSPLLRFPPTSIPIMKGFQVHLDSYSAWHGSRGLGNWPFWNTTTASHQVDTLSAQASLAQLVSAKKIKRIFIVGIALDYCVKSTALDALLGIKQGEWKSGEDVVVVSSASRGVSPATMQDATDQIQKAGGIVSHKKLVSIRDVLSDVCQIKLSRGEAAAYDVPLEEDGVSEGSVVPEKDTAKQIESLQPQSSSSMLYLYLGLGFLVAVMLGVLWLQAAKIQQRARKYTKRRIV